MVETSKDDLLRKISDLESEISRLKSLLKEHNIKYVVQSEKKLKTIVSSNEGIKIEPISKEHVYLFSNLFKGRSDVYALRSENKLGKTAYYPQCFNFYKQGLCKKIERHFECSNCNHRSYKPLENSTIWDHLNGTSLTSRDVIGIYPILQNNKCNFIVYDFDNHEKTELSEELILEVKALVKILKKHNLNFLLEKSRSGNGIHLWMFFYEEISVKIARDFGNSLICSAVESLNIKSFDYFDRLIPKQDYVEKNKLGNLIALPLQGRSVSKGKTIFIDEDFNPIYDQWQLLKSIKKISATDVQNIISLLNVNLDILEDKNDINEGNQNNVQLKLDFDTAFGKNKFNKIDVEGKVMIVLSNLIYIKTHNLKFRMLNEIRKLASFHNKEFYKLLALGYSTKNTKRIISGAFEFDDYICLPRACYRALIDNLQISNIDYIINDEREIGKPIKVEFIGKLYDTQVNAVSSLDEHDSGIIHATTAFGKTVVSANLISKRKTSTLILVHNIEIMHNWMKDLSTFLNIDEEYPNYTTNKGKVKTRNSLIGKLYSNHNSLTSLIDIAMIPSLAKKENLKDFFSDYGMVIIDECHHVAASTFYNVISNITSKYVYGLTATAKRDDGYEKLMFMQLGPTRYRYTSKERLKELDYKCYVLPRFTRFKLLDRFVKHQEASIEASKNSSRNKLIISDVIDSISTGKNPLVLTKYVDHANYLYNELKNCANHVFKLTGTLSKKEKNIIRNEMNSVPDDETIILIATIQYVGEGFNFPRLDTLMLTVPISYESNVEQSVGRLHRYHELKKEIIIYDYVDIGVLVLDKMYHKRLKAYKKIGYSIANSQKLSTEQTNFIFDSSNYFESFIQDLTYSKNTIIISSPGISVKIISKIKQDLINLIEKNVKIYVFTLNQYVYPKEIQPKIVNSINLLKNIGVEVYELNNLYEHFAVIDDIVVWYGNANLLSVLDIEDNLLRLEDHTVAKDFNAISGELFNNHNKAL